MGKQILAAMLSCSGTSLTDDEKYLFSASNPLGISLFDRNIRDEQQLKCLVEEIKNVINRDDVLIAIDGEGGRVFRLQSVTSRKYVSPSILGEAPIEFSKYHATLIADDMQKYGINVNYAPVIETKAQSMVMEGRSLGTNKQKIIDYAFTMIEEYENGGICPCIKHLPGHFTTKKDPHLSSPQTDISLEKIKEETKYIKAFNTVPMAMTAHITINSIDKENPLTMSEKGIEKLIRDYFESDSFLISDAIDMRALRGTINEKAEKCWNAGIDAVCYCSGIFDELQGICQQKRFLTGKSLIRFEKIKKIIHNKPRKKDISDIAKLYHNRFKDIENMTYAYDATEVLNKMLKKGEPL